jgi:serine protease AprX
MFVQPLIRRLSRCGMFLLLALLVFGSVAQPAAAAQLESRVLPQLQREARERPNAKFRVIVTRIKKNANADKAVANTGSKLRELPHDAFVAMLPGKAIEALGRNPAVKYVAPDAAMIRTCADCGLIDASRLGSLYPHTTNASSVWPNATRPAGWTGKGVGVAVLDTGVNGSLKDWNGTNGASRMVDSALFTVDTSVTGTNDGHGHGTHVAGIILGNSWWSNTTALRGKYIGVAPEANLINVKVSDNKGMSYVSDVVMAIDWVVANREVHNIRVMNLSLVASVAESARTSVLAAAVERAWFHGILVVVSAGNSGPNTLFYPPANDPFVITVGASDPMGTATRADDGMAPWSSYGISQDGVVKPDVVAPGRRIIAPIANNGATLTKSFPERIVDGSYIWMSGTSMAAPVVSGIAALAFQAHPEWTNDQVKWLLMQTATPVLGVGQGAGQVNAAAVVNYSGTPLHANQGLTINEQLIGPDGAVLYDSANWSAANWSAANWSAANWSAANWSAANWSAANWSSANWSSSAQVTNGAID